MRRKSTYRGILFGLIAALMTLGALNLIFPGKGIAEAQDDPTPTVATEEPTATATQTPAPSIRLEVTAELAPEGDVDKDGVADPGDVIVYAVTATNAGEETVGPFEVSLLFDSAFIGGTTPITRSAQLDAGNVSWTVTELAAGESETFEVSAALNRRFPAGRTLVQAAAVARINSTEIARQAAPVIEVQGPNVRITESSFEVITDVAGNAQVDPGDTVRFTLSYANLGGGASQDFAVVVDYPDALTRTLVSVPEEAQESEGELRWQVASLPPTGEIQTIQFTVQLSETFPPGVTTYDLVVSLRGATATLDQQTLSVPISGVSLLITSRAEFQTDADGDNLADVGDIINFTIQVANVGTEPATNANVRLSFEPPLLEIVGFDETGVADPAGGAISWTLPTVDVGGTSELSFTARVRALPQGVDSIQMNVVTTSDQTVAFEREILLAVDVPPVVPTAGPTGTPSIQESRPAQGQGILGSYSIAFLIGGFLLLSLLSIVYVASRILPGTPEERSEMDTLEERADHRRLVRELMEGIILTAILFSVMILGLQNALDQDSVNSIIAGIVGYVAGRVASAR